MKFLKATFLCCFLLAVTLSVNSQSLQTISYEGYTIIGYQSVRTGEFVAGQYMCIEGIPLVNINHVSCGTPRPPYAPIPSLMVNANIISAIESRIARKGILKNMEEMKAEVKENSTAIQTLQKQILEQNRIYNGELQKSITRRFQNLPAEMLNNPVFREKLEELKKEILDDVKKASPETEDSEMLEN